MIELDAVTKRFGETTAVDAISLTIETGEVCVLVGTSGCGKSTTLRMINKLLPHDAGRIRIDGQEIALFNEQTLRRRIGYAIQNTGLFPHWTVTQNIALVPRLLKWDKARIASRVQELLTLLGLDHEEHAGKYPRQLSGGQAQRVGVARALAGDPEILLMDEPFGALDPITRESLQNELLRIQSQIHKTIVFVTHDIDEALRLATRIAVMDQGRIVQYDTPERILKQPASNFVEELVGSQDRGLKLAGLSRVHQVMTSVADTAALQDLASVQAEDTLRQALSKMLWQSAETVMVKNSQGEVVGRLQLQQLVDPPHL